MKKITDDENKTKRMGKSEPQNTSNRKEAKELHSVDLIPKQLDMFKMFCATKINMTY